MSLKNHIVAKHKGYLVCRNPTSISCHVYNEIEENIGSIDCFDDYLHKYYYHVYFYNSDSTKFRHKSFHGYRLRHLIDIIITRHEIHLLDALEL